MPFTEQQLKGFWKTYRKAGWNVLQAAVMTKEPRPTWQHRIRACKAAGFKEGGNRVVKERHLETPILQQTFETYKSVSGNKEQAAALLGLSRSTLHHRLDRAKQLLGLEYLPAQEHRILLLDIETAPMIAMVWGTRKQYINHEWIAENGYILCWTAKWLGSNEQIFRKFQKGKPLAMLRPIHRLLDEAHAVVHYNGKKFDVPTLNREFLVHGLTPPSPYKQIDCLQTMWDTFSFPSNKLDYIAKTLKIGQKIEKEGPQFWKDCMADKPEAWKKMEAYNRHDVTLLEGVYKRILPWIKKHPNRAALSGLEICVYCASPNIKQVRTYTATQLTYKQYHCSDCGGWFRGTKSINPPKEKRFALTA